LAATARQILTGLGRQPVWPVVSGHPTQRSYRLSQRERLSRPPPRCCTATLRRVSAAPHNCPRVALRNPALVKRDGSLFHSVLVAALPTQPAPRGSCTRVVSRVAMHTILWYQAVLL